MVYQYRQQSLVSVRHSATPEYNTFLQFQPEWRAFEYVYYGSTIAAMQDSPRLDMRLISPYPSSLCLGEARSGELKCTFGVMEKHPKTRKQVLTPRTKVYDPSQLRDRLKRFRVNGSGDSNFKPHT